MDRSLPPDLVQRVEAAILTSHSKCVRQRLGAAAEKCARQEIGWATEAGVIQQIEELAAESQSGSLAEPEDPLHAEIALEPENSVQATGAVRALLEPHGPLEPVPVAVTFDSALQRFQAALQAPRAFEDQMNPGRAKAMGLELALLLSAVVD